MWAKSYSTGPPCSWCTMGSHQKPLQFVTLRSQTFDDWPSRICHNNNNYCLTIISVDILNSVDLDGKVRNKITGHTDKFLFRSIYRHHCTVLLKEANKQYVYHVTKSIACPLL